MGLPKRVTLDSLKAAAVDGANDSPSSSSQANAFTPINRPTTPLPSSEAEIEALDAEADADNMEEDSASATTSEGSDDYETATLGKGVCEHWKVGTFNTAIKLFKLDISNEWIFFYLRSFHKTEKIKLHHVARFRTFWEKCGRKNLVNAM